MAIHLEFGPATILVTDVDTGRTLNLISLWQVSFSDPTDITRTFSAAEYIPASEVHVVNVHFGGNVDQWDVRNIDDGTTYPTTADLIDDIKAAIDALNTGGGGTGITSWNGDTGPAVTAGFVDLDDVPSSYSGQADKIVVVNDAEDGLEFLDPPNALGVTQDIIDGLTGFNPVYPPSSINPYLTSEEAANSYARINTVVLDGVKQSGVYVVTGGTDASGRVLVDFSSADGDRPELSSATLVAGVCLDSSRGPLIASLRDGSIGGFEVQFSDAAGSDAPSGVPVSFTIVGT